MRLIAWAGLSIAAVSAVAMSCIPDFQFRSESGAGGGTAGGGAIGGGGADTSASTTGGAGGMGGGMGGAGGSGGRVIPQVHCGSSADLCNPGEHCCYHANQASCDLCSATDCMGSASCMAAGNYAVLECDAPADCEGMQLCCMSYVNSMGLIILTGSSCRATCMAGSQLQLCDGDTDCTSPQTCTRDLYAGYLACE